MCCVARSLCLLGSLCPGRERNHLAGCCGPAAADGASLLIHPNSYSLHTHRTRINTHITHTQPAREAALPGRLIRPDAAAVQLLAARGLRAAVRAPKRQRDNGCARACVSLCGVWGCMWVGVCCVCLSDVSACVSPSTPVAVGVCGRSCVATYELAPQMSARNHQAIIAHCHLPLSSPSPSFLLTAAHPFLPAPCIAPAAAACAAFAHAPRTGCTPHIGEHTCVMLQPLSHPDVPEPTWLAPFVSDFRSRFISLLGGSFRGMSPALALSLLNPKLNFGESEVSAGVANGVTVTRGDGRPLSPYDLKRLQVSICDARRISQGERK